MIGVTNSVSQQDARSLLYDNFEVPSGLIALWVGDSANIPSGWLICDGNNGTPDLVQRYPKIDSTASGSTTNGDLSATSDGHSHSVVSNNSDNDFASDGNNRVGTGSSSTVNITVEARPSTTDYIFIMSDGNGVIEEDVTPLGDSLQRGLGLSKNDGSGTLDSDQRNLRGVTSNAGGKIGSDSVNYSHNHSWPRPNAEPGVLGEPPNPGFKINGANPSPSSAEAAIPSVKLYVLTVTTRYGIGPDEYPNKLFLYAGDMSDLDSSWELVTSYDGKYILGTATDGEAGNIDNSTTNLADTESHQHSISNANATDGGTSSGDETTSDSDSFSSSAGEPDRTSLKLVRRQ